jgi:hypothetical protein
MATKCGVRHRWPRRGYIATSVLMRNLLTFWSVHLPKRYFLQNLDRPLLHAFFYAALWLLVPFRVDVFIPCVFGVTVDSISVCLELEIDSGVFPDWRGVSFWRRLWSPPSRGQALTSQSPRCSSIARITWRSSIALMIRMVPLHFGQTRGSTFPAFAGTGSNLLNQSCPAFPECLFVSPRFEDTGNGVVNALLLTLSPWDVAIVSVISHICSPLRDMRTHGRQSLQSENETQNRYGFLLID